MNKVLALIFSLLLTNPVMSQCLNDIEREKLQSYVDSERSSVGEINPYVPYFTCTNIKTDLEKYVCSNKDILLMFHGVAFSYKYALENAFKREFSYKELSTKEYKSWNKRFDRSNMSKLCYQLKEATTGSLGGYSPYDMDELNESDGKSLNVIISGRGVEYTVLYNKNGAVLTSTFTKNILYVGKDCDSFSKKYGKGTWGRANGGLLISFENKSFGFPRQELMIKNSKVCNI